MEITSQELSKPRFQNECTTAYIATVRGFVLDNIARKVARVRKSHGMFEAEEREEEWDEETDLSMGATGMVFFCSVPSLGRAKIAIQMRRKRLWTISRK
jgi:hypothetical protein